MNVKEIYKGSNGSKQLEVRFEGEKLMLYQKQMSLFFEKDTDTTSLHLKNTSKENERDKQSTKNFFAEVQMQGKRKVYRNIKFHNPDSIISGDNRVNSKRGRQFCRQANLLYY